MLTRTNNTPPQFTRAKQQPKAFTVARRDNGGIKSFNENEIPSVLLQQQKSNAFHQISRSRVEGVGNRLNGKQTRIFHATFDSAQKSAINVGFGRKLFLRQFSLNTNFPNSLTESFGNVVAHSCQSCLFAVVVGCRLYTTTTLDSRVTANQNPRALITVGKSHRRAAEFVLTRTP
jgi:hypothetical protein